MIEGVGVLHVDDDPEFGSLTADFLEREDERLSVTTETSPEEALRTLGDGGVDCVVSDYDMPGTNGIEFLEAVREAHPELPFVLFTGKGSEEVASRAVSAGVTDYLQKRPGTEQFTLLANRIVYAVERFRSQQEARRRKQRLETFVGNLPGIVYRCRDDPGWPMEYVAGKCESLTGYAAGALEDCEVLWGEDVVHPADARRVREVVESALEDGEPFECTYRILTADGEEKWVRERGHEVYADDDGGAILEGSILDATESERRQRKFRRSRRRFEAVFDDPNMLVGLLDADGTVLDVNRTALAHVDADRGSVVDCPFRETPWWTADQESDVREWVAEAAAGEYVEFETEHPRPDADDPLVVEGSFRPVTATDGTVTAIVVSARDVTERRNRERELERRTERLDRLATVVSHDLESPISAARGRLELAVETGDVEHVERAVRAIDRVDELRQDLVDVLRTGDVVSETGPVEVGAMVERLLHSIDGAGTLSVETERVVVDGDPDAVRRLLENLVRNSMEHAGRDVEIRVGRLDVGFYYEDDGPGIEPALRDDVFELGFSTKPDGDGVGLGMASVDQIVRSHGWEIRIDDAERLDGVRFEIHTA